MGKAFAHLIAVGATLASMSPQAWGFGLNPAGEFQVNTFTANDEELARVAVDSDGDFVVVWTDYGGLDGSFAGIFGQRYASDGTPLGGEFQVNSITVGSQASPDVAFAPNGDFVAVWMSSLDIAGQRFSSTGAPIGTEFPVNIPSLSFEVSPGVAVGTSGSFVVVWADVDERDGDGFGIFGRRFDSSANPVSGEFQVNTHTVYDQAFQFRGAIATDSTGAFVVAWQSYGQDGYFDGVFAQRFDNVGAKNGAEFQVNTYTSSWQRSAQLAATPDGDFVVTWISYMQDGYHTGIFAQRFASSGARVGVELQVNTHTSGTEGFPGIDVAAAANGDFVVVWESEDSQDGSDFGVFGKLISNSGEDATLEFQVNSYTLLEQRLPAIGASSDGTFVVAWQSNGQDGAAYGIFAQRFAPAPDCSSGPVIGCRTAGKSLLLMKQPSSGNDKFIWKFLKGDATTKENFGAPADDTDYALCIYAGSAASLINELNVPADATKWEPLGTKGFKYSDPARTEDGVQKILLSGGVQGKTKAKVKGKGANLPDPTLGSLPAPVTAQLVRRGSVACWEATYQSGDIIDNDADSFKAKFSN